MGLIVFPLLPPPVAFSSFVFQYSLLSSSSWFAFVDIVLLGRVDRPLGALSSMACSSPKVVGTNWGHPSWVPLVPQPSPPGHRFLCHPHSQCRASHARLSGVLADLCSFGHSCVLKTPCFMAPSLPSLFGVFVLKPLHHWKPNSALSSRMCLIL